MESDKHINNNENHTVYSQKSSKNIVRRLSVPTGGTNDNSVYKYSRIKEPISVY